MQVLEKSIHYAANVAQVDVLDHFGEFEVFNVVQMATSINFLSVTSRKFTCNWGNHFIPVIIHPDQRYTYRVLQTIQIKVILLWVWAERAVLGQAKTALKFKYEI